GREPAVLAGAKQTLEAYRPGLIVDFDPRSVAATGTRPAALAAWLRSLGYDLAVLENDAWGRFDVRRKSPFDAALHCRAGASANVVCLAPPPAAAASRVASPPRRGSGRRGRLRTNRRRASSAWPRRRWRWPSRAPRRRSRR